MSVLNKLTEGIVNRDMKKEGEALVSKWGKTGLLEGLEGQSRESMSRLLENQAKELLREASTMAGGDVEGFAAVAFPIVRRVFAGLIANDLVSVQPMSLPSGLIFFLDFKYESTRLGADSAESIYGGGVVGSAVTGGLTDITEEGGGMRMMGNAYSSPTGSVDAADGAGLGILSEEFGAGGVLVSALSEAQKKLIKYDPDILANPTHRVSALQVDHDSLTDLNDEYYHAIAPQVVSGKIRGFDDHAAAVNDFRSTTSLIRRLTDRVNSTTLRIVLVDTAGASIDFEGAALEVGADKDQIGVATYPRLDNFAQGQSTGAVTGGSAWPLENTEAIPEINIQVDSIAITATTKKLKAKWSPELGQDLNAYHNIDAEVELTSILSEQIALEIDREILADLVQGATAGVYYWSRSPGLFVDRSSGEELGATAASPDFTGTVSEWYETLIETMNDVSAQIHLKTLRGGANFCVVSPEVANILEFTSGFRANVTADAGNGDIGAVKAGNLNRKFDVIVDPYFPRNVVLMGRKGASFLESGYVYAPYVPLMTTPTIFGPDDFVPRKGVMTRYGKKMVRPDMYGLVIVRGLLGESGSA